MGRFMKKLRQRLEDKIDTVTTSITDGTLSMPEGYPGIAPSQQHEAQRSFESNKPESMRKDVRMISGCEDSQTSADVSNVRQFQLPDAPAGGGGACTSTLLNILYKDEQIVEDTYSFTEILEQMRINLGKSGYTQIPQLTSLNPIDVTTDFQLIPEDASGTRRAVMIGINYVGHAQGQLSGCHNDVLNMKKYIMDVHGFEEENIVVLMDDGIHSSPTASNMIQAYQQIVADSEDGDAIFLHYSGHGTKLRDDNGDEDDGYDEALVPVDFNEGGGMIRDDDLFDILIKPLAQNVHMVSLMDCCHSGTILDLPYIFAPKLNTDGSGSYSMPQEMTLDETIDLDGLVEQFGGQAMGLLVNFLQKSLGQN